MPPSKDHPIRAATSDIATLLAWFPAKTWPMIRCPGCEVGLLEPSGHGEADAVRYAESARSKNEHHEDWWDPYAVDGTFRTDLVCTRSDCGDLAVAAGSIAYELEGPPGDWVLYLRIRTLFPAVPLFRTPNECPETVSSAVHEAGGLLLYDPAAAGARLRVAVERMLTDRGVARFQVRKHKRERLSAHERIGLLRLSDSVTADQLEAVKWIGNEGAHGGALTEANVLDCGEVLAASIDRIYGRRDQLVLRITKDVNKRRGV